MKQANPPERAPDFRAVLLRNLSGGVKLLVLVLATTTLLVLLMQWFVVSRTVPAVEANAREAIDESLLVARDVWVRRNEERTADQMERVALVQRDQGFIEALNPVQPPPGGLFGPGYLPTLVDLLGNFGERSGYSLAVFADTDGTPYRFAVAERRAGREPELDDPAILAQLGRFIGRLHAVGRQQVFEYRHHLAAADAHTAVQALIAADIVTPAEMPAWRATAAAAADAVAAAFAAFESQGPLATLRLHGDCHIGNVLWRAGSAEGDPGRPHIVDLDDAMQGPAVQDLWMLVSGDAQTMARQLDVLLRGYEDFSDFDDRERALIEPLRTWRMLRHSAWLAARWSDPTFPIHFPWFGSAAYWSQQTTLLREQLELMGA